jgi:DNA-binding response OmpR family regulator
MHADATIPLVKARQRKGHLTVRILLVEDDESIGGGLTQVLVRQGYEVDWQTTGETALVAAETAEPDLVLLDLGLPDIDGVELCRMLRSAHPALVIVMVTARDAEIDVVLGLDAGADDYITKPFHLSELLARLRSHERRRQLDQSELTVGDIDIDRAGRRVSVHEHEVNLSPKEFDLLALLASESGRAVTRERIVDAVWDPNWYGSTKTLDMHIVALRRKLADAGATAARITTLRGVGYRLDIS